MRPSTGEHHLRPPVKSLLGRLRSRALLGQGQSLPFVPFANMPELRPLRSTGITRLRRYCGPLRHPERPGHLLTEFQLEVPRLPRRGFPCCVRSPCAGMPSPLPRRNRCAFSLILPSDGSLPSVPKVGFRISIFEACSAFTHVTACRFARSPSDPLHRRLRRLRYLHHRSDCYWLERELPGGTFTR